VNERSNKANRALGAGVRMKGQYMRLLVVSGLIAVSLSAVSAGKGNTNSLPATVTSRARWVSLYASFPLRFELNEGQTDGQVKYLARGAGYTLFLTSNEAVLALRSPAPPGKPDAASPVVRLKLLGANPELRVTGEAELPGQSNYFLGKDARQWHTHVPNYAQVRYRGLYGGVDLVYYGHQGELEYDFVVARGADPGRIRLRIEGAHGMKVDAKGNLVLPTGGGKVRFHRPVAYQGSGRDRHLIAARYLLRGRDEIGFAVGPYDRRQALIIDPVLSYATYLGGTGGDVAYGIAVDSSNNAYIAGVTNSTDFPNQGAEQKSYEGNGDAFVVKLDSTGTTLVYSTYIGGGGSDTAAAIAVDATGDAFISGTTTSTNFPTTASAFQTAYGGDGDAFVTELNSAGDGLVYSSYLGGSQADSAQAIAVDSSGNAYLTGSTQSIDFPTTLNPLQPVNGGTSDAFVAKVNFSGTALVYSTYLGGSEADVGQGIKVDSSGNVYIVGYTFSSDFPVQNALQTSNAGAPDAFVAKLNASGSALTFSTYLGGSGDDRGFGVALDTSGNIYVTGASQSTDFPTTSTAFQTNNQGSRDAFVSKLNSAGSALTYSTFLGGSGADQGNAIAVDSSGDAFVTGFTQSSDFPTANPVQAILGISGGSFCGSTPCSDAFVSQLNPSGSGLVYSTYLGGNGADFGQGIALDATGDPYVTGSTSSTNFPPTAGAFQGNLKGAAGNAFVAKIDSASSPGIAIVPQKVNFGNQTLSVRSAAQTVTIIDVGTQPLSITDITSSSSDFAETDNCVGTVAAGGGTCTLNVTFTPSTVGSETDQITITDNASGSPHTITLNGTGVTAATAVTLSPTSLAFGNQTVGTVSSAQTATITNTGTATLNITSITATGDYSQTNTCGAVLNTLNVGQSCAVSVAFAPTASGGRNGTLSINDNAAGSPQTVALSGTGVAGFSLSSSSPTTTVVIGSSSATIPVSASAPSGFTGNITLSCSSGATCSFNPSTIFAGQSSTLTASNLTPSTANPFNFTVNGTSGSQTATLAVSVLFSDYSLSVTPALNTITSGQPATYSLIVTPLNGFNKQVQLACSNLPAGASCSFSSSNVTPQGGPVTVTLTVNTIKGASSLIRRWLPPGGAPPPAWLLLLCMGVLWSMLRLRRYLNDREATGLRLPPIWSKTVSLGLALALVALLAGCRPASTTSSSGTPTGNYTITVTGTLSSNTAVVRSTTVNLAVT